MNTHKDLEVWKKAIDFSEMIYSITKTYPNDEKFGLVSQMRRAVVSISANIAEGAARKTRKEFVQFLYIARGSASELDTLLEISDRTNMAKSSVLESARMQNRIILKMLTSLTRNLDN